MPSTFEALVRSQLEPLQYAAFFGALVLLGLAELLASPESRKRLRGRRWPSNGALTVANILVMSLLPVSALAAADWAASSGIGLLNLASVPAGIALATGLLLRSLAAYAIHVAMHKVPLLWRVHRVHHCDTHMDVSTTVRFHPLEFLFSAPILIIAVAGLGIPPLAILLFELIDAAMAVFTHADVRLPRRLERLLRLVVVTPDMHRIHHSAFQPETDSNYGATLSVWDRLLGTYRAEARDGEAMTVGLEECQDMRASSFRWLALLPFRPLRIERVPDDGKAGYALREPSTALQDP